ncbi:vWA domain-containing protein [Natrialbaceae archaeon A-gly3]
MSYTKEKVGAVFFAVLMATSMIAMPALAAGPGGDATNNRQNSATAQMPVGSGQADGPPGQTGGGPPGHADDEPPEQNERNGPPGHDRGDVNVTVPELEANTSIEALLNATERLNELDLENEAASTAANETAESVNASLGEYRQFEYVDSRTVFEHVADAQRSLVDLHDAVGGDDEVVVEEISRELYAASDRSARLTVTDAQKVVVANEDEFRNPGQRQSAESALGNAVNALERADETISADSSGQGQGAAHSVSPSDRANALTHLENAWKHGERALDTVEDNTEPTLSLSQNQAFERNGTVVVPLKATLSDVRPYAYDEADVTIDGDGEADDISLIAGESADSTATGMTLVDVGPEPKNVTATVTATHDADNNRSVKATTEIVIDADDVVPELPAPDEYQEVEITNESSGVSVDAAGNGLHETTLSVSDETPETDDPYRAGPMVRITNETPIDEATVEIPIDEGALDRDGNLSVMTWDPRSEEPWTPIETEIDHEAGVASADVDHFSFFSVFWVDDWEDETSDTITLDGNETDGDVGDGNQIEKSDFVFVIDVSGSMSGSRIVNARLAAQRFVGAFEDDEQGALVAFSSSSTLVEGLTTDHDALNSSIESLSAGGLTNTGSGLQEGIDELEANGWENRSQTIILLADGGTNRGPNPVGVASDAAEKGINISTVGLGSGIDENELRAIAGEANGDYYHVEDAEDLPDTFERVAENETGVDLTDTNGDGIPDLVADMDLSMPTGEPGVVGEPLELDRIALDTSDDGILDNETVDINYRIHEENNETKLTAQVTYAEHHPARVDTTGDGLTDAEQLDGWEIEVVDDPSDAQELMEPDDSVSNRDLSSYFQSRTVSANPLVSDTSGDGLSDTEERALGIDPEQTTTVADGIPDTEALDRPHEDPTVFSTTPPDVSLIDSDRSWTKGDISVDSDGEFNIGFEDPRDWDTPVDADRPGYLYEFDILVVDSLGIDRVELRQSGVTEFSETYASVSQVREDNISFYGEGERILTEFRGAETDVTAEDEVGNTGSKIVSSERSIAGRLATQAPLTSQRDLGRVSGLAHAGAELPDFVRLLVGDTEQLGEAIAEFSEEYMAAQQDPEPGSETEFWIDIARNMGADTHQTQARDNPEAQPTDTATDDVEHCIDQYVDGSEASEYCQFAAGWYEGYSTFVIVETVIGSKGALRGASSGDDLRRVLDDAGDNFDAAQELRRIDNPEAKTGQITYQIITDGGNPNIDAPAVTRQLREEHGIETAGGIQQALGELEGLRHVDELSASKQATLGARISKSSDPSAARTFVTELDDIGDVRYLLEETDISTTNRLVDWHANPSASRNIDPDLGANDLVHVAKYDDVMETTVVAREVRSDGTTNVLWLSKGTDEYGQQHIIKRHATGEITRDVDTDFYPVGGTVEKSGTQHSLPNNIDISEIDDMVYAGIKQGTRDPNDPAALVYNPSNHGFEQSGITEMRIVSFSTEEGITTAYPVDGPDVVTVPG